ncbi:MAG: dUTP diphosphatase [Methanogenium sp.]|jgi:dUTP pyrophosphatase
MKINVIFEPLKKGIKIPTKAHLNDVGYDVFCQDEEVEIEPAKTVLIKTGFKIQIPDGYWIAVCSRSGHATKGIIVTNSPGVIDPNFRDEVGIIISNVGETVKTFRKGDKIAQLILMQKTDIEFVNGKVNTSERVGGFGSSDEKR